MTIEAIREFCRTLPHVTEAVKWRDSLCFLIGGKIFAIASLEHASPRLSFKCTLQDAQELIETEGIIPAPYLARYHWVTLERPDALRDAEIRARLTDSYRMKRASLPRKMRESLAAAPRSAKSRSKG